MFFQVNTTAGTLQLLILCFIFLLLCEAKQIIKPNKCTKCPPGWGVTKKCTGESDTECVECLLNRTYSPHYSSKSRCWLCSQCGVGLFESHRCSPIRDTICSECVSYLDHKNLMNKNDFLDKCGYLFLK